MQEDNKKQTTECATSDVHVRVTGDGDATESCGVEMETVDVSRFRELYAQGASSNDSGENLTNDNNADNNADNNDENDDHSASSSLSGNGEMGMALSPNEKTVDLSNMESATGRQNTVLFPYFFGRHKLHDTKSIQEKLDSAHGTTNDVEDIGESITEHAQRTILPKIIAEAEKHNHKVAEFATRLISDAMHLRNIYSHRWSIFALKCYKLRNSHNYHRFFVSVILLHCAEVIFTPPRGEWESMVHYLRWFEEGTQIDICKAIDFISILCYALDLLLQCCFQVVAWRDVDYTMEFGKSGFVGKRTSTATTNGGRRSYLHSHNDDEDKKTRIRKIARQMTREVSERIRDYHQRISSLHFNTVFILNTITVSCFILNFFDSTTFLPNTTFLRPFMIIWINYRVQTASGAMVRMLPALSDILIILVLYLIFFAGFTSLFLGPIQTNNGPGDNEGFDTFLYSLLNYYVLLSTETFPNIIDFFPKDNIVVPYIFASFLLFGYFILMAYLTAIVFDGYYDFKLKISLKEYFLERTAVATTFLVIAYDPETESYNDELTLSDILDVKFKFNGKQATFTQLAALFQALDENNNCGLDETEFYRFCDALTNLFENISDEKGEKGLAVGEKGGSGSIRSIPSFSGMKESCNEQLSIMYYRLLSYIPSLSKFLGTIGQSHVLFFHILQIFRQGLVQIFLILSSIWVYAYATIGIETFGTGTCLASAAKYKGEETIEYYESFQTFQSAMLATFRLATGSGWHELLYMYWGCAEGIPLIPVIFFVSFHFTFCILFYNILGGLIFAQYKQLAMHRKKQAQKNTNRRIKRRSVKDYKRKRTAQAVPEMRRSAQFWREELQTTHKITREASFGSTGEEDVSKTTRTSLLFKSPQSNFPRNADSPNFRRLSSGGIKSMWEQYTINKRRLELVKSQKNYTSETLQYMGKRMLKPSEGLEYDVALIKSKQLIATEEEEDKDRGKGKQHKEKKTNEAVNANNKANDSTSTLRKRSGTFLSTISRSFGTTTDSGSNSESPKSAHFSADLEKERNSKRQSYLDNFKAKLTEPGTRRGSAATRRTSALSRASAGESPRASMTTPDGGGAVTRHDTVGGNVGKDGVRILHEKQMKLSRTFNKQKAAEDQRMTSQVHDRAVLVGNTNTTQPPVVPSVIEIGSNDDIEGDKEVTL